ncbi:hypothetical protein NEPAR06_0749 [Nematocida parisii]|nr:hypothetical protein NEPAR07_0714 [Nematocida parisii]KAI5165562.1 hypothetical protein NEIRO02_0496 [Nematocida sp. AWRm79]KAI5182803.1 hypothetical protein NEIRO03_0445 [Nematocida sp. AWRm78]OAG33109.1 hypothetical protein NEIG_02292 [Nematocida sp. ERTm5]KAI5153961.1 hypothetical protein NEPAR06_0749 [Nematocida parisii]
MNTESIKRLAEEVKKAQDLIQEARKEKDQLEQKTIERAKEYEEELLKKKVEDVKKYFKSTNEDLARIEESIIQEVKETIDDIRSKDKLCEDIMEEIVKTVIS